jgi:predicted nucleotide-binding protein
MKPKLFIGSSVEGKPIAEAIHSELQSETECTIWTHGVFGLSNSNIESLMHPGGYVRLRGPRVLG